MWSLIYDKKGMGCAHFMNNRFLRIDRDQMSFFQEKEQIRCPLAY